MSLTAFKNITFIWLALGITCFAILSFIPAPYGRHTNRQSKLNVLTSLGWMIMESPAVLVFTLVYARNSYPTNLVSLVWFAMWMAHYVQRTYVYSWTHHSIHKTMPLTIVLMGFAFNCANAYLNATYLYRLAPSYPITWLAGSRFIVGVAVFVFGYIVNRQSDHILWQLRRQSPTEYQIPSGGLYRWVSCPNYLGEILIWCGWALATWSPAALAFCVWTVANLAPRAGFHHRWYKQNFSDYPAERKALIPGIW